MNVLLKNDVAYINPIICPLNEFCCTKPLEILRWVKFFGSKNRSSFNIAREFAIRRTVWIKVQRDMIMCACINLCTYYVLFRFVFMSDVILFILVQRTIMFSIYAEKIYIFITDVYLFHSRTRLISIAAILVLLKSIA